MPMVASAYREESVRGLAAEQELKLMQDELRVQRRLLLSSGCLFIGLFLFGHNDALVAFRPITLFNGLYFLSYGLFLSWQDTVTDLDEIRRRGTYRVYMHAIASTCAYVVYSMAQNHVNKDLAEMGCMMMWPLSMGWESRDPGGLPILRAYLTLHGLMTIVRFSGTFFSGGWQSVVMSISANLLIYHLAKGRETVLSDKDQLTSLCSTIQRLLRSMCDGYCVVNSDGVIVGADIKLVNLLAFDGTNASILNRKPFQELLTEESPSAWTLREGLQTHRFRAGDDSVVSADVYTVASALSQDTIRAIIGHECAIVDGASGGFFCAMRHVSISETGQPVVDDLRAEEVLDILSPALMKAIKPGDVSLDADRSLVASTEAATPKGNSSSDSVMNEAADGFSQAELLSEAPSYQYENAVSSFFSPTKNIGIGVGDYKKVDLVSRGAQGAVWKVHSSAGKLHAMKELRLPGVLWRRDFTANLVRADREVRCLKRLQWASSVIVQTVDCWLREDMVLCIVMEWLPLTLRSVLTAREQGHQGPPPFEDVSRWLAHVVSGIAVIHSEGFLHRDLKPSNLLLTPDLHRCKVADMGLAREVRQPVLSDELETRSSINGSDAASMCSTYTVNCGTRGYQSPEILQGGHYNSATDIYSLGCVLLGMLSFEKSDVLPLTPEIVVPLLPPLPRADASFSMASLATPARELQQLCLQMLNGAPAERPTALVLARSGVLASHVEAIVQNDPDLGRILGMSAEAEEQGSSSGDTMGVVQLDARGCVRNWSVSVAAALGVQRESAIGRRLLEGFVPSKDRTEFSRLVGPVVRGLASKVQGVITLQSPSRRLRFVATVRSGPELAPSRGPGVGRLPHCLGVILELSPLRSAASEAMPSQLEVPAFTGGPSDGSAGGHCKYGSERQASGHAAGDARPEVRSTPAHLVSLRPASPDRFVAFEGLHERNVRAWSTAVASIGA